MDGVEFLENVAKYNPDIIRILVTAFSDASILIDSINRASIYQYVKKPYNPQEMTLIVEQAIEYQQLKNDNNILVTDLKDLFSGTIMAIIEALDAKDSFTLGRSRRVAFYALKIAQKNANNNKVKINFIESNMFKNISETFDVIVSNPPYIKTDEISKLSKQVQNEPKLALDGGKDGLDFYRIIAKEVTNYLNNDGALFLEIGFDQGQAVAEMFKNSKIIKDYAGNDRVMVWITN